MDKAFHYYCIRVLAEKAGFPPEDAQTIAYASQYVDDATEHKPFRIENAPVDYPRYRGSTFDPICTAHGGKTWFKTLWKWAKFYLQPRVQRQILMAFHFLPPNAIQGEDAEAFDYVTRKDSPLANELLDNALKHIRNARPGTHDYQFGLVSAGLAVHTFCDTWSHHGFSGRHNSLENDIEKIRIKRGNRWTSATIWEDIISYAAPDVGHSEASSIPDTMGSHWKARYADNRKRPRNIERDNTQEFYASSKAAYVKLSEISPNDSVQWKSFAAKLKRVIGEQENWKNAFPDIAFSYSRYDWREKALSGDTVNWDDFDSDDFSKLDLKWTRKDRRWFWFHQAAYMQRTFLADKIPDYWLSL